MKLGRCGKVFFTIKKIYTKGQQNRMLVCLRISGVLEKNYQLQVVSVKICDIFGACV